ncbi:hypothetical protein KQH61_05155 [bacterium]|nr:hypothetical protein [bacterium]MCB2179288.1 hypothetical protein [bacterium]
MKITSSMTPLAVADLLNIGSPIAFRPSGRDAYQDGVSDFSEALAEVLGMDADTLQVEIKTAKEETLSQAIADGILTQEQANAYLSLSSSNGSLGFKIRGVDFEPYLADTLDFSVNALQTAQHQAASLMIDQAYENGSISQEEYERLQFRSTMSLYFEKAYSSADQNAIDAALADGAITEAQAELLLSNTLFGRQILGEGRMHGVPHFHSDETKTDDD